MTLLIGFVDNEADSCFCPMKGVGGTRKPQAATCCTGSAADSECEPEIDEGLRIAFNGAGDFGEWGFRMPWSD